MVALDFVQAHMDILGIATAVMAVATLWLAFESKRASFRQIGVQTWLELEQRFNSEEMKSARKKLAQQLKDYRPTKHEKISEAVLNFFESVGTSYKLGYLDKKLANSSFSFYACRWWEVAKPYIDQEQKRHSEDDTLFEDFMYIARKMRQPGEKIDKEELDRFLKDEEML